MGTFIWYLRHRCRFMSFLYNHQLGSSVPLIVSDASSYLCSFEALKLVALRPTPLVDHLVSEICLIVEDPTHAHVSYVYNSRLLRNTLASVLFLVIIFMTRFLKKSFLSSLPLKMLPCRFTLSLWNGISQDLSVLFIRLWSVSYFGEVREYSTKCAIKWYCHI